MAQFFSRSTEGPGGGLFPASERHGCLNRTGGSLAQGSMVSIDLIGTLAEVDDTDDDTFKADGAATSAWRQVGAIVAADIIAGFVGTVLDVGGIANDEEAEIGFFGLFDKVSVTGSIAAGAELSVVAAGISLAASGANDRIVGLLASPDVTATPGLTRVMLNGITGWGYSV